MPSPDLILFSQHPRSAAPWGVARGGMPLSRSSLIFTAPPIAARESQVLPQPPTAAKATSSKRRVTLGEIVFPMCRVAKDARHRRKQSRSCRALVIALVGVDRQPDEADVRVRHGELVHAHDGGVVAPRELGEEGDNGDLKPKHRPSKGGGMQTITITEQGTNK